MAERFIWSSTAMLSRPSTEYGAYVSYSDYADLEAENKGLIALCDKYKWQVRDTCTRAERAEAQLDGANKALDALIDAYTGTKQNWEQAATDAQRSGNYELRNSIINTALQALASLPIGTARRAREAQGGE